MKLKHLLIALVGLLTSASSLAQDSLLKQRIDKENQTAELPFVLTPHKVNYFLPVTYNSSTNIDPFLAELPEGQDPNGIIDELEAKFQISFKFPLMYNIFGDNGHLFLAYTNQSYWQMYNKQISSPFRDSNHEPEIFMVFNNDWKIGEFTNSIWGVGTAHQSNGQATGRSRSWNRLYGFMVFDNGPLTLSAEAWWRIPEDEKEFVGDPEGDDNPDLIDYIGNIELTGVYGVGKHRFTLMMRNNLRTENKGAYELTWSYPIKGNLRFYAQYFNGYGESLIDYNHSVNRIGIGFSINDLL